MIRVIGVILLLSVCICARGQQYNNAFYLGWNSVVPFADKDFTSKTSSAGIRVGFSKFSTEKFGWGFDAGYSTLKDYIPRQTYEGPGQAITTDIYHYLYYLTATLNGQYYLSQGKHFITYTSLGLGISINDYRMYYNVYQETDNNAGFLVRPEVAAIFRIKEYSAWGFKAAVGLDYSTNASKYFQTENFLGLNLQLGLVKLSY